MSDLDKLESRALWNVKALALIAIVACHCCHVSESPNRVNQWTVRFFDYWISYGVPIFYFVAGYLFQTDEKGVFHFWKKKIKTVLMPWIFTGTLVWLYVVLRKGGMNWWNWFSFLFLKESYLYFLTDLLVFFALFYWIRKNMKLTAYLNGIFLVGVIVFEILNIECMVENVPGKGVPVVNMLVFYIGMLFRHLRLCEKIRELKWVLLGIPFIMIRFIQLNIIKTSSGILLNVLGSLCLVITIYSFCYYLAEENALGICTLGKYSFSIYLLHMPVAGVVANLLNRSETFCVLTLWRPMMVIGITFAMIKICEKICCCNKQVKGLLGIR